MTTVESRLRIALGTFVAVEAEAEDSACVRRGIEQAFQAIQTVQNLMHPVRGTDLAALAASRDGQPLQLHRWTYEVLTLCKQLHAASCGIFDPCMAQVVGGIGDLQLLPNHIVRANLPMQLDLGGIAKGFAVDCAVEALRAAGCSGGLVNAGGDLAAFGPRRHRIVCTPSEESGGVVVDLGDAALATSDARPFLDAFRPAEHRGYYDGRDRRARLSGRVTVIASRAAIADGLATCLLAAPRALSAGLLSTFGAEQVLYPSALSRKELSV